MEEQDDRSAWSARYRASIEREDRRIAQEERAEAAEGWGDGYWRLAGILLAAAVGAVMLMGQDSVWAVLSGVVLAALLVFCVAGLAARWFHR